jgi:hypothetical protein
VTGGQAARLGAVAALALVLFNSPVLAVFDVPERVLGVPVLWAYLLLAWAGVIGLVAWTGREP